jgi:hypothetical protein
VADVVGTNDIHQELGGAGTVCAGRSVQPRNHRDVHGVGFGDLGKGLASRAALDGFLALYVESFGLRPNFTPFAMARLRPSPVRSLIRSRSNSAIAASNVESRRPCELEVSQSGSPSDRNAAPALPIRSIRLSNSRVERPSLSSFVTSTTSPSLREANSFATCGRSALAPLSRKIVVAPATVSWPVRRSWVLTRA